MIHQTVVRPHMTVHGECFVLVDGVANHDRPMSLPAAINQSRRVAEKLAKDNYGNVEFTNRVGLTEFDYSFFLVTWDDLNESPKAKVVIKERQIMPMIGAALSFIGAYLIGTRAETARDWFLFIVMTISFASSAINAYEARK